MDRVFFLAANSGSGFFSLYDGFPGEGVFLHIIKGGPGTGKSGFMRRIKSRAEKLGMDTETILCSGDPDSLDALYIPALRQAWVDGTAPHVREPSIFGADSDYVNLGDFCRLPLKAVDRERAEVLNAGYKAEYASAYGYLAAAKAVERAYENTEDNTDEQSDLLAFLDGFIPQSAKKKAKTEKRFISAISCMGIISLNETVNLLCKQKYEVTDVNALLTAAEYAEKRGLHSILCPDPLDPDKPEALLLPDCSLCITLSESKTNYDKKLRRSIREEQRLREKLLSCAVESLASAKAKHDELENVYRPYMDFEALTEYTGRYISDLFG